MDERNERLVFDRIVRSCCRVSAAPGVSTSGSNCSPTKSTSTRAGSSSSCSSSSSSSQHMDVSAPRHGKPQYFLVSPKLLPALRSMDNDDVTALMVWNGPGVAAWTLADVISNLRKLKRHYNAEDSYLNAGHSPQPIKRNRL
jgi:hypothetical protein